MHHFLMSFGKIFVLIHGFIILGVLAIVAVLVCIIVPIYAKAKRNIRFHETLREMPGMFLFIFSNIIPIIFIVMPVFHRVKRNAKKGKIERSYKYDFSKLKKGDVILTGRDDWGYSQAIQVANILTQGTKNRYWTHACIYTAKGTVIEAQTGGKGVIERDLIENYEKKGYKMMALRHKYMSKEDIDKLVEFGRKQVARKCQYDSWGLLFYVINTIIPPMFSAWLEGEYGDYVDRLFNITKSYFCSELVADAFKVGVGKPVFSTESWRVKPTDFRTNLFFEEIKDVCKPKDD